MQIDCNSTKCDGHQNNRISGKDRYLICLSKSSYISTMHQKFGSQWNDEMVKRKPSIIFDFLCAIIGERVRQPLSYHSINQSEQIYTAPYFASQS